MFCSVHVVDTAASLAIHEHVEEAYVRGYHAHIQALSIKREPANAHDVHAVAVYYEIQVVGHVPYNLAPTVYAFLRRDVNKGFAEVTGDIIIRSTGAPGTA